MAHLVTPFPIFPCLMAGRLIQLDGRRPRPVDCGPTSDATLLKDSAAVVKAFAEMWVCVGEGGRWKREGRRGGVCRRERVYLDGRVMRAG